MATLKEKRRSLGKVQRVKVSTLKVGDIYSEGRGSGIKNDNTKPFSVVYRVESISSNRQSYNRKDVYRVHWTESKSAGTFWSKSNQPGLDFIDYQEDVLVFKFTPRKEGKA